MTLFNYKKDPQYPDRYSRDKKWVKVLPVEGRPFQSAEFIEIQSILQDNIKQGFNSLFDNGAVLSGLKLSVIFRGDTSLDVQVTNGQCYIEGFVLDVLGGVVTVPSTGDYNIGLRFFESILTPNEDSTLRDPIKGGALYGTEGASRLIWDSTLVLNDKEAYTIGKVLDGNLIQPDKSPFSKIDRILEQYTYERSGHFCVRGLEVSARIIEATVTENLQQLNSLEVNVSELEDVVQQTLSDTTSSLNEVLSLREQVRQAEVNVAVSPTVSNQNILVNLKRNLQDAENRYTKVTNLYLDKQKTLEQNKNNLSQLKSNLSDKVNITVNPGVAYILGRRVSINYPYSINVNRTLDIANVDQAVFTYSGDTAKSVRSIDLKASFTQILSSRTRVIFKFASLKNGELYTNIQVSLLIPNTVTNVSTLIDYIVSEFNKRYSEAPSAGVIFTSTSNLSQANLRAVIKDNLSISKSRTSNFDVVFESTTISNISNQINIVTVFESLINNQYVEDTNLISFDITNANLAGGGQSRDFVLGQRPVKEITSLVATLEERQKPLIRGAVPGTADNLADDTVISISQVTQGDNTFIEGVDYELINQSQIDWSLLGDEPASGTTYYVTFTYTQALVENTDFKLDRTKDSITFIGKTPAPNKTFTVDYSYYLAKSALVTLDSNGVVSVLLSSTSSKEPIPPTASTDVLTLASLTLYANEVKVKKGECSPFTFKEIRELVEQVKKNQVNLELLRVDNLGYRTALKEIGGNPIGMFNNNLQDFSKIDLENTQASFSICPITQSIGVDYKQTDLPLKYISGGVTTKNPLDKIAYVTLAYTQSPLITQNRKTYSFLINNITHPKRGKVYIDSPLVFNNRNLRRLTPCDNLVYLTNLATRTSASAPIWLKNISNNIRVQFVDAGNQVINSLKHGVAIPCLGEDTSFLNELFKTGSNAPLTIQVRIEELVPNSQPYKVYLAGQQLKTISSSPIYFSALEINTLKADANGVIEAFITLPSNLGFGTHLLEFISSNGYAKSCLSIYNNLATQTILGAISTWQQTLPQVTADEFVPLIGEDVVERSYQIATEVTSPGVLPQIINTTSSVELQFPSKYEPLLQTFKVPTDCFITQVWLKFKSVDNPDDIIVYLRESVLEEPTGTLLGVANTNYIEETPSGTIWSRFVFTHPIALKSEKDYCFSINTYSEGFEIYSSVVGDSDIETSSVVGDQLYLKGTLFKSRDGISLSQQLKEDLTFSISSARFSNSTIVSLGSYGILDNFTNINAFCLNLREIIPTDTSITYEYREIGGRWNNFKPNVVVCLGRIAGSIELRAKLNTSNTNVSPVISLKGSTVTLYSNNSKGVIISKQVDYLARYKKVSIFLETIESTNNNIKVYFSDKVKPTNNDWILMPRDTKYKVSIDPGIRYVQYRYSYTSAANLGPKFTYKIELEATNISSPPYVSNILSFVY